MAQLEIRVSRTAERGLRRLERRDQQRIVAAVRSLASDPRPPGSRKLQGYEDVFRIRVGAYRILYSVSNTELIVIVLKIGHRRDVYRR